MSSAPVSPVTASLLRSAKSFSVNAIAFTVCIVSSPTHGIERTRSTLHCTNVGGRASSDGSARSHAGNVAGLSSGIACTLPAKRTVNVCPSRSAVTSEAASAPAGGAASPEPAAPALPAPSFSMANTRSSSPRSCPVA